MQAKDISDVALLNAVAETQARKGSWANRWDLEAALPGVPPKVVLAKARRLVDRELISGCGCGCRGDFEVLPKGHELIQAR